MQNNRNEEALGSGIDIKEAFQEGAFEELVRLFTGYVLLVEDCEATSESVKIQMKYFRAMEAFTPNLQSRDKDYARNSKGVYPSVEGVSYMDRFDILCRRLMQKRLYTAAAVIKSPRSAITTGEFQDVSPQTSIKAFLAALASHVATIAAIQASDDAKEP